MARPSPRAGAAGQGARRTPKRGHLAAALASLAPGAARALLPGAGEFQRATECIRSGRYLDVTKETRPEELPPCIDACPFGTEGKWQQCVQQAPDEALEEIRLTFQLRERCLEAACGGLQHWNLHLHVLDMKVAQYLGVATQELHSALLFYPTVDTPWVSFESGNSSSSSSGAPERPPLKRFFLARRDEPGFQGRRMDAPERWYVVHTAFRVESARISLWSRPVREIAESMNVAVSNFLGTDMEVLNPQANITDRNFGAVSHADFRAIYEFEGYNLNRNPYVSDASASRMPGTALGFECASPCWEVNEQDAALGGAHRCGGDCDCAGMRRCSPIGYCSGNAGTCTHTSSSANVPGYECRPSGGHGSASGARFVALSPESCGETCDSMATCGAFEWHGPDFCFLIAQSDFELPEPQPYGAWSVCKRLPKPTTTTLGGVWQRPFEGDPLAQLSSGCRASLVRTTAREGLDQRLPGCSLNETASYAECLRVSCIGIHTMVADLACQADICGQGAELYTDPVGIWSRACDETGLVGLLRNAHSARCAQPTPSGEANLAGSGAGNAASGGAGDSGSEDSGGSQQAVIIVCSAALPVVGCFCALGRAIQLRYRRQEAVPPPVMHRAKTMWSPPELGKSSSWHLPMAHEPPPQMKSPSSPSNRFKFGWPFSPSAGEPSPTSRPFDESSVFGFGTPSPNSGVGSTPGQASPRPSPRTSQKSDSSDEDESGIGSPDARTPSTRRSARSAPTPRRLKSSPPMLSGKNRDVFWQHFKERSKSGHSGRSPTASSVDSASPSATTGTGRLRAAARESSAPAAPTRHPATPASAWAEESSPAGAGADNQEGSKPGSAEGDPGVETPQPSEKKPRPASPTKRSRIYSPAAETPGQASSPGQNWSSDTPWTAGPAAWTAAGSSSKRKAASTSLPQTPARDNVHKDEEALSPKALAAELEKLRQSSSLPERRRYFLSQCLKWHPDKNVGNEARATQMFHVLQEKKDWFLAN